MRVGYVAKVNLTYVDHHFGKDTTLRVGRYIKVKTLMRLQVNKLTPLLIPHTKIFGALTRI